MLTHQLDVEMVETQLAAILGLTTSNLASGEIRGAWSSYLELVIEPAGWLAVWIPSAEVRLLTGPEGRYHFNKS